jgi:hypothetical protein
MRRLSSRTSLLVLALGGLTTLVAPAAAAAAPTGSITGTVTAAATHLPIAGVRVCARSENFYEEVEEFCAHSAANGTYAIGDLPEERYTVEFISAVEGLNYVYQAWNGRPDPFEANLVKVTTGEVPGIDAALEEGGMIGGRVTSFSSGAPIAGIEVCAEPKSLYAVTVCGTTDGAGQYTILGLSGGDYRVEFWPPEQLEFLTQYFDREPGLLQADAVGVQVGQLTPNVNATLLEGGQIAGQLTDAVTHAPVARVSACTFTTLGRERIGGCGESGADGRYLIRRVPAGVYTVHYFTGESVPSGYREREYTGICGNDPVAVTVAAGALTAGIDAGLFPSTSFGLAPPECAALASRPPEQTPKRKRCRKGTRRRTVHGKKRCVKVRKHRHHKRHTARRVALNVTRG